MKVTIENYRGIEIWFDTNNETFQCDIDDERSIKKSYPSVKQFIDTWSKSNENFRSFMVDENPNSSFGGKKGRIIGRTKDGRFFFEKDGKKEIVSKYNEKDFIIHVSENIPLFDEIKKLRIEENKIRLQFLEKIKYIKEKIVIETLSDYKQQLDS